MVTMVIGDDDDSYDGDDRDDDGDDLDDDEDDDVLTVEFQMSDRMFLLM